MTASCTPIAAPTNERSRVLMISGADRHERTARLIALSRALLEGEGIEVDLLDPALHRPTDVYEKWLFAHAIVVIAPAGDNAIADVFKPAIDRMAGAGYPAQLADRAYGVVVHGQSGAAEHSRRALTGWFDKLGMVDSDSFATLDRHVGYQESFQGGEQAKADEDYHAEVRNVTRAVANAVTDLRAGRLTPPERRARRVA